MKAVNVLSILLVSLFSVGTAICAECESNEERPFIGIQLDPHLPDLLIKHLRLSPGQGVRIANIQIGSPADKAGLERDDIIIAFEGKDVTDIEEFVEAVREAGIGKEVSLEIIHLGKRKTVKLTLEPMSDEIEFKYPQQPHIAQYWHPGRIFRMKPEDDKLMVMPFGDIPHIPSDGLFFFKKFFQGFYTYVHSEDGERYTVTIEGNPNDDDTEIVVRADDTEYRTTVNKIKKLPRKFRAVVKEDLKDARKSHARIRDKTTLIGPEISKIEPEIWRHFFDQGHFPGRPQRDHYGPGDRTLDEIERQMRELQQRIRELERHQEEMLDRLPDQPNKEESRQQKRSIRRENKEAETLSA